MIPSTLLLEIARVAERDAERSTSIVDARHLLALRAELLDDASEARAKELLEELDLGEDEDLFEPLRRVAG